MLKQCRKFLTVKQKERKKRGTTFSVLFAKISSPLPSSISKRTESMAGTVSVVNFFPDPTRAPREESTSRHYHPFAFKLLRIVSIEKYCLTFNTRSIIVATKIPIEIPIELIRLYFLVRISRPSILKF